MLISYLEIDNFRRKMTHDCQNLVDLLLGFWHLSSMLDFMRAPPSLNVGFSREVFTFSARCRASKCPRPPLKSTLRERGRGGEGNVVNFPIVKWHKSTKIRDFHHKFDGFLAISYLDFARLNSSCFHWYYRAKKSVSHSRQGRPA